jgi:NAD(P)H-quinone oxidoreductase subunit 5
MDTFLMQMFLFLHLILTLLISGPVLWFLSLAMPARFANRHPLLLGGLTSAGAWLSGLGAATAVLCVVLSSGEPHHLSISGVTVVSLDVFSAIMASLIAFLGWVIVRYSKTYLLGDPRQGTFLQWLGATLGSVQVLVLAGNFGLLLLAWIGTSLCLHHLLVFYPEREAARISGFKKFVFSRLADACLIGAAVLLFLNFQTLNLPDLMNAVSSMSAAQVPLSLKVAVGLIAFGAILKSAQFPFHTWLPDTLETPTPVSALMHAGIISAGGFLLIRLSPMVALVPEVMLGLAGIGAVTALFGSLVMLTQTSVKKALAFSTVAQMGYMILQCGLGAFSLAALHLVAHSLYKAHTFLNSGSTVQQLSAPSLSEPAPARTLSGLIPSLLGAWGITLLTGWVFGVSLKSEPSLIVLGTVLALAVTTLLWTSRSIAHPSLPVVLGFTAGVCVLYFSLHHAMTWLLAGVVPSSLPETGAVGAVVMGIIVFAFAAVFLLQGLLPNLQNVRWFQHLYVLIFNRFYVNAFVNRLLLTLRPIEKH